jgi:hypothetical protein
MLSKTKRFAGVAAAMLAVHAGIPAAGAAASPCRAVVAQSTGSEVAILLEGHYSYSGDNGPIEVSLTCHIVQNGVKVVSVGDFLSGPTAALVSDERIGTDPFYVCYTFAVTPIGGPLMEDYPHGSDC